MTSTATTHRVEWFIDHDTVVGRLVCEAPEGRDCRLVCPQGCETWPCQDGEGNDHGLVDSGKCNAVEWIDAVGTLAEFYDGSDRRPLRDGPVFVRWNDDAYTWAYTP